MTIILISSFKNSKSLWWFFPRLASAERSYTFNLLAWNFCVYIFLLVLTMLVDTNWQIYAGKKLSKFKCKKVKLDTSSITNTIPFIFIIPLQSRIKIYTSKKLQYCKTQVRTFLTCFTSKRYTVVLVRCSILGNWSYISRVFTIISELLWSFKFLFKISKIVNSDITIKSQNSNYT